MKHTFLISEERSIRDRANILCEGNLRIYYKGEGTEVKKTLERAVEEFLDRYRGRKGDSSIDLVVSANLVLYHERLKTYSLFFGNGLQLTRKGDVNTNTVYSLRSQTDLRDVPSAFALEDFRESFQQIFDDTEVSVHSIASLVFILRRHATQFTTQPKKNSNWLVTKIF